LGAFRVKVAVAFSVPAVSVTFTLTFFSFFTFLKIDFESLYFGFAAPFESIVNLPLSRLRIFYLA
jgi:hypothetical protein